VSRAERREGAERILAAGLALGARAGVGALSLQAIAAEAGVSKALLLYHFAGKAALLDAILETAGRSNAARLRATARAAGPMEAWRALLRDGAQQREAALVGALALEDEVDHARARAGQVAREDAATHLATAVLAELGLTPRVPAPALGLLLLRQMDGLAAAYAPGAPHASDAARTALDAEIDTFALALLGLAR